MKKTINIKQLLSVLIIVSVILMMCLGIYYNANAKIKSPKAVNGQLDLSDWDFEKDGIALLNGEWNFYPERLIQPSQISLIESNLINVPGTWGSDKPYLQPYKGSGTYQLTITLPNTNKGLVLKVQNIWMAHRIFINGSMVKEMGIPAEAYEIHQSKNTPYLLKLDPSNKLDIIIQVSNHMFYSGGIIQPIKLGDERIMERRYYLSFGSDIAAFFLFLVFGVYHINMYMMRREELTYLYSSLYLIFVAFIIATSGEKIFMMILENVTFQIAYKIQDLALAFSFPVFALFIRSLEPTMVKKKALSFMIVPSLAYIMLIIFTPYYFYTSFKSYITVYVNIILFTFVFRLIYILIQKHDRKLPLNEFTCVVTSITFISVMLLDAMLVHTGNTYTNLVEKMSQLGFLLSLNNLLASRFTNKMYEVQALSEELKKSNQIKDEFLARTSHELKTPLHGISNIAAYLLKENYLPLTIDQRENVSLILDTSKKLSLLVNDLIDATKLRHEDVKLQMMTVDLYVITQVVFQLLTFDIEEKDLKLVNRIKPMTFVNADENRLRQILYNIIVNAVKYTECGQIVANTKIEGANVVLTISDTGKGIQSEQWELIFQDYYRWKLPGEYTDDGIGLGLYISRQLARKMKGDVWISHSVVGEGTTIAVSLTKGEFIDTNIVMEQRVTRKEYAKKPQNDPQKRTLKKILLVDDEPTNIRVLSLILKQEFEILTAYRGDEALKLLQNNKIDLAIVDMMMPGMSGIELTKLIRKSYSVIELPIIMATVRENDKDIELAYSSGASDYITKPFTAEEILIRIRVLLQLTDAMETALQNEIAFLQAQIKPHFIYNALSNIIALCYEDGERAGELLALLSRYLRHIFQMDQSQQMLPLGQELDIIKAYVEIEKLRFGDRLQYKAYIDPGIVEDELMVPALLIQPLIENAIRHGLFNKEGLGTVTLMITEGEDFIRIVVEDDGIGMSDDQVYNIMNSKDGKGVGIKNIRKRVESISKASFYIDSQLEKGTRCILFLSKELLKLPMKEMI